MCVGGFTCRTVIRRGVWSQTHRRIIPLLPEEITIGSKEAALGMWGIPGFDFYHAGKTFPELLQVAL